MDLQLGLSVSRGFDLNSSINIETEEIQTQKRRFHEAFEDEQAAGAGDGAGVPRTLALLVWEKENRAAGDLDDEADSSSVLTNNTDHVDDRCVVGWPPVSAARKKICQHNRQSGRFVKVKMEGVGIARKVDINLHLSPQPLLRTLLAMFGKCEESAQFYQLKYQDGEGDWQLVVDDVNWGNFRRSVQRLEVVKKQ